MSDTEAALAARLKRMQRLATGLLALMALVFVTTSFLRDDWPWLGLAWAFSEAALIGGLADWFAVTALFRHPLGLPIPHTAIVPRRKNEIGGALARFIANHFMTREVLEGELGRLELARSFGQWLTLPAHAASIGRDLARALAFVIGDVEGGPLRRAAVQGLGDVGRELPVNELVAALLDTVTSGSHSDAIVDQLVAWGREQLERNKPLIRERIHDRSPWWLPRFVDEEIFDQLVSEIGRLFDEIGADPGHPARAALGERLQTLRAALTDDAAFAARSEALRHEFFRHPAVARFGRELAARTQAHALAALADPGSELRQGLERELVAVGRKLTDDAATAARLDAWLAGVIVYVVETYREPMSSIIATTIAGWDAEATSRRIELQIGRDLQFIRINGTLVGGVVGLLLYLSWTAAIGQPVAP